MTSCQLLPLILYDRSKKSRLSLPDLNRLKSTIEGCNYLSNSLYPKSYMLFKSWCYLFFFLVCHITSLSISSNLAFKLSFKISLPLFSKPFFSNRGQRLKHTLLDRRWRDPKLAWLTQCWGWVPHNRQIRCLEKGDCDTYLPWLDSNVIWTKISIMQYKLQGIFKENLVKIIKRCFNSCHIGENWSFIVINFG